MVKTDKQHQRTKYFKQMQYDTSKIEFFFFFFNELDKGAKQEHKREVDVKIVNLLNKFFESQQKRL